MGVFKGYQPNTFRAISGSLFSTAANWSRGYVPTGSDAAVINDNCTIDITRTIGSLVVGSQVTASISGSITFRVNSAVNSLGRMICVGSPSVILNSKNNVINSLSASTSTFTYGADGTQNLPGFDYFNLNVIGYGRKTVNTGNLIVSGTLLLNNTASLELSNANLYVSGTTTAFWRNFKPELSIKKSQYGNLVFDGLLYKEGVESVLDFSAGNPDVELRNNFGTSNTTLDNFKSGQGVWSFTTRNQRIYLANPFVGSSIYFDGPIVIRDGINLSLSTNGNPFDYLRLYVYLNNTVNATSGSSRLINSGSLTFTNLRSLGSMTTGTLDLSFPSNVVDFGGNYTATIPTRFGNRFYNLNISGTGIKSIGTNIEVSGSLDVLAGSALELAGYDLYVSGTTNSQGILSKTGSGKITFENRATLMYPFFSGNPTVEFRSGAFINSNPSTLPDGREPVYGTGSFNFFSSSAQSIQTAYGRVRLYTTNSIGPGVTLINNSPFGGTFIIYGSLTGIDATSRFVNQQGGLYFANKDNFTLGPASYDFTSSLVSEVGYVMSESITLPYTNYGNLVISGSGAKILSGNTTINGYLYIGSEGGPGFTTPLELGNFDLTVVGDFYNPYTGYLSKTGPGTVTLGGTNSGVGFRFSGNPAVIFKTVGSIGQFNNGSVYGSGSYTFSGNCRVVAGYDDVRFSGSVIVSGSVSASFLNTAGGSFNFSGSVNGTTSSSIFVAGVQTTFNNERLRFTNPEAPMLTGSLRANTIVPNSVQYDYVGPLTQSIQVPTDPTNPGYYNLYLTGSAKKLLGNISVKGILSTGSTTIDFNGFTLTNP